MPLFVLPFDPTDAGASRSAIARAHYFQPRDPSLVSEIVSTVLCINYFIPESPVERLFYVECGTLVPLSLREA